MTEVFTQKDCFTKLKIESTCRQALYEYALTIKDWEIATQNDKFSFLQAEIPYSIVKNDKVISSIATKFRVGARIFKMPKNTYYSLHRDGWRGSTVNMLLNDSADSTTFFEINNFRRYQVNVINLKYEQNCYYLLNTRIRHAVINLDQDRFVFSMGLGFFGNGSVPTDFTYIYNEILGNLRMLDLVE